MASGGRKKRPERPNVVFINLESLGGNRMGLFGNLVSATPKLDGMGRNGLFFPDLIVPSSGTVRSIFGLVTGFYDIPWRGRTALRNPRIVEQDTLVNALENYGNFSFIGGSAAWAHVQGLLKHNFEGLELWQEGDYDAPDVDLWGLSDHSLFEAAHERMARMHDDQRFVAFITTAAKHRSFTNRMTNQRSKPAISRRTSCVSTGSEIRRIQ